MRHLYSMGNVKKSGVWVPHALSQNHKNQRVAICAFLLARNLYFRARQLLRSLAPVMNDFDDYDGQ